MSLLSTSTVKNQLSYALDAKAPTYWRVLQQYLTGQISRGEFDEQVKECLETTHLITLHNSLIVSLFDTSAHLAPPTPPPDAPKPPPRKRRRTLPYQGFDGADETTLRSTRLKKWTVGMGKRERDRVRALEPYATMAEPEPHNYSDEVAAERGVKLLPERGESAGSRLALHLGSSTRYFSIQHMSERINLISAQHNLNPPSKAALALTSTSLAITSVRTSSKHSHNHLLSAPSFDALFTISPAVLPNKSAAAMRLALGDNEEEEDLPRKDREVRDQRWQLFALLSERSTVKEALRTLPG